MSSTTTETGMDSTDDGEADDSTTGEPAEDPLFELSYSPVKHFDFDWTMFEGAEFYQLFESLDGKPYEKVGGDLVGLGTSLTVPLHFRRNASYSLRACDQNGCVDAPPVDVWGTMAEAIGYFKASNTEFGDFMGYSVALSDDGKTLVVGAPHEDSEATGIDGDQANNAASNSGAVYVYVLDDQGEWTQQAYVKASNPGTGDEFGTAVALSGNGNTLVVGAPLEDSAAMGVQDNSLAVNMGAQNDNSSFDAGAVYLFVRDDLGEWTQQNYIKASNTEAGDNFGGTVALSSDGLTLAVGSVYEDSGAQGFGGDQTDNSTMDAGAVYVFTRDWQNVWSQQVYAKASNPGESDSFGHRIALSFNGSTLAVGAVYEDSGATGVDGDQLDETAAEAGAVYVLVRGKQNWWTQQAYIKAPNTDPGDFFSGGGVVLSADGNTLAIGAAYEDGTTAGGDALDNFAPDAGAVHVYARDGQKQWSQQSYLTASNAQAGDMFGYSISMSDDGFTVVVSAVEEDSDAIGIGGDQEDDSRAGAGAAYVFVRDQQNAWMQRAYVKASNTDAIDRFGFSTGLSSDGTTMVISSLLEASDATGVGGNADDDSSAASGAVYMY